MLARPWDMDLVGVAEVVSGSPVTTVPLVDVRQVGGRDALDRWGFGLQVVTVVAVVATAVIYLLNLRAMYRTNRAAIAASEQANREALEASDRRTQATLLATKAASQGVNLIEMIDRMQDEDMRQARGRLIRAYDPIKGSPILHRKPLVADAEKVGQVFDVVAMLTESDVIPRDLILEEWGVTMYRCFLTCELHMRAREARENHRYVWPAYERLVHEAVTVWHPQLAKDWPVSWPPRSPEMATAAQRASEDRDAEVGPPWPGPRRRTTTADVPS